MAAQKSQTLASLLCEYHWVWNPEEYSRVKFNEDGSGELYCGFEIGYWLGLYFTWRLIDLEPTKTPISLETFRFRKDVAELRQFHLEMTLTRRPLTKLGDTSNHNVNEKLLTDAAFEPRTFLVKIEQGCFISAQDERNGQSITNSRRFLPRYGLRLSFDESPNPRFEDWKDPTGGLAVCKVWEWQTFVGRALSEEEARPSAWESCNVM